MAPEGPLRDRRGDPWLTAGVRPVRFASRGCAALRGRYADDYGVAATVLIQTRLSPSVAKARAAPRRSGRFVVPGRITPRQASEQARTAARQRLREAREAAGLSLRGLAAVMSGHGH